jgi:acetyl esterase/lipase
MGIWKMNLKNDALKELWKQIAQGDQDYYDSALKPQGASISKDIYYANTTEKLQALEIIRPKGSKKILPVIVHIHGGGWIYGHKDSYYKYYCMELSKRGYAVLNINYRLAFDDPYPACVQDIFKVFEWMSAHASEEKLDLNNVFLVGDSAGAHLSALCTEIHLSSDLQKRYEVQASPIKIKALGLSCGVYDVERHLKDDPDPMTLSMIKTVFHRNDFRRHPLYRYSSVSTLLSSNFPPAYVLSSKSDIPLIHETQAFIQELKALKLPYKAKILPKKLKRYHVFNIKLIYPESIEVMDEMTSFFQAFTS